MKLFKTLKKSLWEVLEEQEPFGIVNNQNIDYYLEKATMKAEKEIKEQSNTETKQLKAENESLKKQLKNTKSRIYISYEKGLYGDTDYAILFYVSPNKTFYVLEEFTEEKYGKKVKEVAEARLKELEVSNAKN